MSPDATMTRPGRQGLAGARSPFPLADRVPALLADDPMIVAFLTALDEVWAPVIGVLDCFDAYLDPRLAPADMVAFLGSWVLAMTQDARNEDELRADVAAAPEVAAWSGTAHLLHSRLVPREAGHVEISDPGSIHTSTRPTDPVEWPDADGATIVVTVTNPTTAGNAGRDRVHRIIRDLIPAHVPFVVRGDGGDPWQ